MRATRLQAPCLRLSKYTVAPCASRLVLIRSLHATATVSSDTSSDAGGAKPHTPRQVTTKKTPLGSLKSHKLVQEAIHGAYYRGGTSRALIFDPRQLPVDRSRWPALFLQLMGSPDPYGRQLDGMGAGISSLSKICLVEPVRDAQDTDIDYTFVGLGIEGSEVDVAGNCGNMSSAIGPFAYNAGMLKDHFYREGRGEVTVRIRNTNTNKYMLSTFEVVGGQAAARGDYKLDGVAGTGSKIKLDFLDVGGSKTNMLLPTNNSIDMLQGYEASCVDGANPCVFVRADDVGIDGTILPNDFNKLPDSLQLLEDIRRAGAVKMGMAKSTTEVPRTIPKIGIVSTSITHKVLSGDAIEKETVDLVVRFLSDTQPHRAIPLTAALTTAIAAKIEGTIVQQMLASNPVAGNAITMSHASGRIQVNAQMDWGRQKALATVYRTAKRIFEGNVYWTDAQGGNNTTSIGHQEQIGRRFLQEMRSNDDRPSPAHQATQTKSHPELSSVCHTFDRS